MRIKFKVLMLCFKCLNGLGPKYLSDLLEPYVPGRSLRNRKNTLRTKRSSNKAGDQCFSVYAPALWNSLPDRLRAMTSLNVLRTSLKTHFFSNSIMVNVTLYFSHVFVVYLVAICICMFILFSYLTIYNCCA